MDELFGDTVDDAIEMVEELFCVVDPPTNAAVAAELSHRMGRKVTVEDITHLRYTAGIGQFPDNHPTRQERQYAIVLARRLAYTVRHNLEAMPDRMSDKEVRAFMLKTERKFFIVLIDFLVQNRRGDLPIYMQKMDDFYGGSASWGEPDLSKYDP